jgi:hypothetical protein
MTEDELFQFRDDVIATLGDFEEPVGYGVAVVEAAGARFPVVNADGLHRLPAAVLASVLGYRSGTCTLAMSREQLDESIERLAPAEACTAWDHPNLWSWRELRTSAGDDERFVVVFVGHRDDRASDDAQRAFRREAGWG